MKLSKSIKIIALVLALVIVICSVFLIRGCSAPPKYEEIETRLKELIEASYDVNVVLFGTGLPTYERVSDPKLTNSVHNTGEFYENDGEQVERKIYYYHTLEKERAIVAFRDSFKKDFSYAFVSDAEMSAEQLMALFPAIDGIEAGEGQTFYEELYRSQDGKKISYLVPYVEQKYDFYYSEADPDNYDYIRNDCEIRTIEQIKELALTVYSSDYVQSLSSSLFDGVASGDSVMLARYTEYIETAGSVRLAQLNTYEPLFTERKVYDFSTARVISVGSNSKQVRISINTYLPSNPDRIFEEEVTLKLQDGQWFLSAPTF